MRIIPEYEPVGKLYLSFVQDFFHSRFNYGITICEIARAVADRVTVEVFVSGNDTEFFLDLMADQTWNLAGLTVSREYPSGAICTACNPQD